MQIFHDAKGSSHAKIILIGEHAVVYGHPAIALPLKTVTATASIKVIPSSSEQIIKSSYYDGSVDDMPKNMLGIKKLILKLVSDLRIENGFELHLSSQLPAERGMGSSAAVAISIIRCFYNATDTRINHKKLLSYADIAEKVTHNNPSGLDATTSASDNPIWLIRNKEITPIPINLDAYLLISDSGIKGQTSEAIKIVKDQLNTDEISTSSKLAALGRLAQTTRDQLANNDIVGLGKTFTLAQKDLISLGVSTPKLDNLINIALKNGSLGSKLTGGGRGGCFISLLKTKKEAEVLAKILNQHGVTKNWIEPLSNL
ncbi:mevalonate kinase [Ligilactobacillus salivarius]|uniref:mevalonate kinase n=1 Tax=Ligilactobacillus salivarius TaxID=1624 RepID=UPI0009D9BDD8|nr:mevalonate kinase [Ligilactobacillus salivarius]OQQ88413.1 mevalonate kinase [Ligilactobacillus salivarius]